MEKQALDEKERLAQELREARGRADGLERLAKSQAQELDRAWSKVHDLRMRLKAPVPVLNGRKVAVIGPSFREEAYRRLVEQYGGRFSFAPSEEKLGQIDRAVSKAQTIVFITTCTSHAASNRARAAAERYGRQLLILHSSGLDRLENLLVDNIAPQF